jgi:hypothetical protein
MEHFIGPIVFGAYAFCGFVGFFGGLCLSALMSFGSFGLLTLFISYVRKKVVPDEKPEAKDG